MEHLGNEQEFLAYPNSPTLISHVAFCMGWSLDAVFWALLSFKLVGSRLIVHVESTVGFMRASGYPGCQYHGKSYSFKHNYKSDKHNQLQMHSNVHETISRYFYDL